MAFVKENLTIEEKKEFISRQIHNPHYKEEVVKPSYWVTDKERNIILIRCVSPYYDPEELNRDYFLLIYKDYNISAILEQVYIQNILTWKLIYLEIPKEIMEKESEIIEILREAMKVYNYTGIPNSQLDSLVIVKIGF